MAKPAYAEIAWVDEDPPEAMPPVPQPKMNCPATLVSQWKRNAKKWQIDILIDAMDRWLEQRGEGYTKRNMFV